MSAIVIKNVRLIKDGRTYLNNVNLLANYDENMVIQAKETEDIKSCQYLVSIIASSLKPTAGSVDYAKVNDNRILLGYKNFENIFKKNIKVSELINELIKTQKLSQQNLTEIDELKEMLNIDDILSKQTNNLNQQQIFVLNLLTLLIVKPHMILIDNLNLPGSQRMHAAILSYLKEYCKTYKIKTIISSNEKFVADIIADRKIIISKTKIVSDTLIKRVNQTESVEVDNKTKAFDLHDDIIAVLNNKVPTKKIPSEVSTVSDVVSEKKLIEQLTKALDPSFDLIEDEETDELSPSSLTNDLFTKKVEHEIETDTLDKFTNSSLNEKFTDSLEFKKEEMKQKTRRLNDDSKDVLEDIKISQQKPNVQTKQITRNFSETESKNNLLTNDFLSDLRETYAIRKELGQQIKSPDFTKLTPELQLKVFDNYDRADSLIKETDPEGIYDPYREETVEIDRKRPSYSEPKNHTVTKMIIEETIHTSNIDDEIEYTSTSRYETEEINDKTLNNVIDNIATNAYFDDTEEYNTNKYNQTIETDTDKLVTKKANDFTYIDNEKKNRSKKSIWRDRFMKKEVNKNISDDYYGKQKTESHYTTDSLFEKTDDLDDFTKDLKNSEPTSKLTSSLNNTSKFYTSSSETSSYDETNEYKPTIKHPSRPFNTRTASFVDKETKNYKPPKTMAIKQRSKKNLIERLYDEALEDSEIIQEYKDKKNK